MLNPESERIARAAPRAAMAADPAWAEYLAEVAKRGMLVKMENRIVKPAPFYFSPRPMLDTD